MKRHLISASGRMRGRCPAGAGAAPAGMLAHGRAAGTVIIMMPPAQRQIAGPSVCTTFALASEKEGTCGSPTQHIRGIVIVSGKYLTNRQFSHFAVKTFSGTGARAVRGCWRKHKSRSRSYETSDGPRARARTTTTTSLTEVKREIPHIPLHLSHIPVLYIPRILKTCPDAHYTGMPPAPAPAPAAEQKEKTEYVQITGSLLSIVPGREKKKKKVQKDIKLKEVGFFYFFFSKMRSPLILSTPSPGYTCPTPSSH